MENYEELSLDEIQKSCFVILKKIKEIFDENGWKYYLTAGTLLGAARHQGFIPWDDDIDLWVPRPDYEKFIDYCIKNKEKLYPFELIHYRTNSKYIYPIARFSDSRFYLDYNNAKNYGLGLFVDLYPLDGLKDNYHVLKKKIDFLKRKIILCGSKKIIKGPSKIKNLLKIPYYILIRDSNLNKLLMQCDILAQKNKFEECDLFECVCWADSFYTYKKEWLIGNKEQFLEFNGDLFRVPFDYDKILTRMYGDYMKLPPKEEQIAHHFYRAYRKKIKEKNMKYFGIVSYNIHANFTNYGSALQSWALSQTVNKLGKEKWSAKLVDYCPDILANKDPLNPMKNMWDKDEKMLKECKLSLPAIKENYQKFMRFYNESFNKTTKTYNSRNFNDIVKEENISGFICGSDTIFCIDEFGFDDGYYANYKCMKEGQTISYAASFGDAHFNKETYELLNERLQNFKAIALRENNMIEYVKQNTSVEVKKVLDPTLLLDEKEYEKITFPRLFPEKYILLYSRRYNQKMYDYVDIIAKENGWKVVEISLMASNAKRHKMFYSAGVEEFLSLVKHAEFIVTNSFHGMIFSVQFKKQFVVFSREQCSNKIEELLNLFGLKDRLLVTGKELFVKDIDYNKVFLKIKNEREKSLDYLAKNLEIMYRKGSAKNEQ